MQLFLLFIPVAVFLSFLPGTAGAAVSVSQGFFDISLIGGGAVDRVTSQSVTWMKDQGAYGMGLNVENAKAEVFGGAVRLGLFSTMFLVEKPLIKGVFIGAGAGFVRWYANGTPVMLCNAIDVYGRVQLLKIGNASVGTFLNVRWMSPTPIGNIRVFKTGIEVGLDR